MITLLAAVALASPISQSLIKEDPWPTPRAVFTRPGLIAPSLPVLESEISSEGTSAIAMLFEGQKSNLVKVASGSTVAPKAAPTMDDKLVDVVCTNSDVNGVLALLSASTKANLVLVSPSEAKMTLRLKQVRLIDAVRHIAAVSGLAFLKVNGAFLFGDADKLKAGYPKEWEAAHPTPKPEPPVVEIPNPPVVAPKEVEVVRVVPVSYKDATQLATTLKALYEGQGLTIVAGPGSSTPTLGDRDTAGSTGVSQGVLESESIKSKTVILRGTESVVKSAIEAIKALDQPGGQVKISVSIHDVNDAALRELGVSWNIGGTTFQESSSGGINFGGFSRTPFNFGATIRALETQDKAQLLASPEVTVLDNERAFVLIGNKLNLPKFDGYDANKIPIYSTSEYRVGIYLQVAASIAADGTITLAIYPQVSTVVKTTEINGASYPDIATREAQTTLRIKSGETIVIGGLLRTEELDQLEQVPILSKIPLFGELFKRRKKTRSSSQVVISLTPTLVLPDKS